MLTFQQGVAYWNDQPTYFVTAEYPYFRDDPKHWEARLQTLRALGVQLISTYIPWRHHDLMTPGERRVDFNGETLPNRNVLGFLATCQRLGLYVLLKPGPFCHAELNYGGLVDVVCPLNRQDIPAILNADNQPVMWVGSVADTTGTPILWPLPSIHAQAYHVELTRWFDVVRAQVLEPCCFPDGPVIAVQVGNEGIYSDAQHAIWANDYSAPAIARFRAWLRARYGALDRYNHVNGTALIAWDDIQPPRRYQAPDDLRGLHIYRDWAAFAGDMLAEQYQLYARLLDLSVPALANVNPPVADRWGIDAWLCRVQPERWDTVNYGYTNWIGVAAADPSALARYMLLTRRAHGPNLEENWGFATIYDPAYASTNTCVQQTLVAIAGGATGYNLYTAVGTAVWDENLDRFQGRPYPSHAPVTAHGEVTAKAEVAAQLNTFFRQYGSEFVACVPQTEVAFGFYQPYAELGAWFTSEEERRFVAGHHLPQQGPAFLACQQTLIAHGIDLDVVQLQTDADLDRFPVLIILGGPFMDPATQVKLANYHCRGGKLILIGEIPTLNEDFSPCTILAGAHLEPYPDLAPALDDLPRLVAVAGLHPITLTPAGDGYGWVQRHTEGNTHYVIALNRWSEQLHIQYVLDGINYELDLTLAARGGAIVRVENGEVTASFILDSNDEFGQAAVPGCQLRYNSATVAATSAT